MNSDLTFITNEKEKQLKQRIVELIKNSKELRFLVGFFYFSGKKVSGTFYCDMIVVWEERYA